MSVLIIGGGASGMVAAIKAAKDHQVTILEQRDRIGRKLLATGNGRCNMTNTDQSLSHYHGLLDENLSREFAGRVFAQYGIDEILALFKTLGIETKDKNGYIYPASEQASAVLDVLRFALSHANVKIICDCRVDSVEESAHRFYAKTSKGDFYADNVILCPGSKAQIPKDCTDGYALAKSFSHTIVGPIPALVQLCSDEKICKPLAGIRTHAGLTISDGKDQILATDCGEIQFTAYALSGIPAMQVSHIAAKELDAGSKIKAELDLLPDKTQDAVLSMLEERLNESAYKTAEQFLIGLFHKNLGIALMKRLQIPLTESVSKLTQSALADLSREIKHMAFPILQTRSFADAQVCAGGVVLREVKDTLESMKVPGLYFAGEILDIHGDCGGYNLQWAFGSGMLAGSLQKEQV